MHGAQFKAKVLAECSEPGASVAAVAMANGLNANVVRKWLEGRGLKRTGLVPPNGATLTAAPSAVLGNTTSAPPLPVMQFMPVGVIAASNGAEPDVAPVTQAAAEAGAPEIHVELRRGDASVAVRWPAAQAQGCAAWLGELAAALVLSRP